MKALALTGGIGMGKSTAADCLRQRGISVVDTDQLARQVVEPGQPALAEIQQAFGAEVLDAGGGLRRGWLAEVVFADAQARERLEAITHPRIRQLWRAQLDAWRAEGAPLAVVVIPLLFEIQAQGEFDATICVACSAWTQRQRLLARGWSPEQIERRIRAQLPPERKMALADYVLWNEGGVEILEAQLERVLGSLIPTRAAA